MTLKQIKKAIADGKHVFWKNEGYEVIQDSLGQYLIIWGRNKSAIGLTWADGITLNGKPSEFYICQ